MSHWRGGGIRRDKYDALFSELVRMRANWTCERCGVHYGEEAKGELDCSHVYGRRNKSVRVHPDNALCACRNCHQHLGENPIDHAELVKKIIGRERYERLTLLANKPTKFTTFDREVIHTHYLDEKKRMRALRRNGVRTRIEFTLP
jgi:hypothetical protein